MINRLQHLMILALYTLFSVFMGVVCITVSDSFYVGIGGFFIFFLLFLCGHIFWLGNEVTSKVTTILYDVEDGNNFYQQELKNIRSVMNNVTDVMKTLVNDNDSLQQQTLENQKKYELQFSDFRTQIEKLKSTKSDDFSFPPIASRVVEFEKPHVIVKEHELNNKLDHDEKRSHMNVRSVSAIKPFYDKPVYDNHEQAPSKEEDQSVMSSKRPIIFDEIEKDFLNLDADDSFRDLTAPEKRPNTYHRNQVNIQDDEDNEEFATVDQKVAESYRHLLEEGQDEIFLETIDEYQTKDIREQLQKKPDNIPSLLANLSDESVGTSATEFVDEFVDVTTDLSRIISTPVAKQESKHHLLEEDDVMTHEKEIHKPENFIHKEAFDSQSTADTLPSLADLLPDEKLKHIAHRSSTLTRANSLPSLDSLLNQSSKPLLSSENVPKRQENISVDDMSKKQTIKDFLNNITEEENSDIDIQETFIDESFIDESSHETSEAVSDEAAEEFSEAFSDEFIETHTPRDIVKIIRQALENNSLDLFIRPVTDSRVREVKFFEVYNYLRDDSNRYLRASEFMPLAHQEGMGVAIDRLMFVRSVQALRNIMQTITDSSVFYNISILSFIDPHFCTELEDLLQEKPNIAQHLIFEFSQDQLEQLSSVRIEKIMQFVALGIRFSLDNISGVLPDLLELVKIGISFIKLQPDDFINGINCNGMVYKGKQIKKAFTQAGLVLCVSAIDKHEDLLFVVDNQVDLLQGDLLGQKARSDRLEL